MNERELRATAKSHGVLSLEQTRDIIDTADLVWGVVPDGAMMIIKGVPTLEFIISTGVSEEMSITAVHIESLEQGMTLQQLIGCQ